MTASKNRKLLQFLKEFINQIYIKKRISNKQQTYINLYWRSWCQNRKLALIVLVNVKMASISILKEEHRTQSYNLNQIIYEIIQSVQLLAIKFEKRQNKLITFYNLSMITKIFNYRFPGNFLSATQKNAFSGSYDLITIGPYANRIAKQVSRLMPHPIQILTIEEENFTYEQTLIPFSSSSIKLNQQNHRFSSIEKGVGVAAIDTEAECVLLKNGNKYNYRQLVFSGDIQDWKAEKQINLEASKNSYQLVKQSFYDDKNIEKSNQLFRKSQGHFVYIVPKSLHLGYNNYFMLLQKSKIQATQSNKKVKQRANTYEITVVCQGNSLCPQNKQFGSFVEKNLLQNGIKLIKNSNFSINYQHKRVQFQVCHPALEFSSLFNYLPLVTPPVLKRSSIDALATNTQTFIHPYHQNIHILLPSSQKHIHSLQSIRQISNVISFNVMFGLIGVKKRAVYQTKGSLGLWIGDNEWLQFDLQKGHSKNSKYKIWDNLLRKGLAIKNSYFLRHETERLVNGKDMDVKQKPRITIINDLY